MPSSLVFQLPFPVQMAVEKLTEEVVANARAPSSGRLELWDADLPGFGLRVSETGRKSWQLMYRMEGRKRRMTLGTYPALSLELARDTAFDALREVRLGNDPAAQRASVTGGGLTFEGFAKAYVERHAKPNKRSWAADARMIDQDLLPAWRRRGADSLTRRDVIELLDRVHRRGHPYAANRRLALVRKMFAWGIEADMVTASPVIGIKAPGREERRERVLSDPEVASLWRAWDKMGWPFGPMFKLMLLTAQRRNLVAAVRLADITLPNPVWIVPKEMSGTAHEHEVPLSPFALEILASLPRLGSPFVFPARGNPDRHVSGFSAAAKRVSNLSDVSDWRTQDLRRTAISGMVDLGTPGHVVGRILNYRPHPSVVAPGDDNPHAYADEKRTALETWAGRVQDIVGTAG